MAKHKQRQMAKRMIGRYVAADPAIYHHFSDPEWDGEALEPEPPGPGPGPGPRRQRIKVKLADGKARTIQHMMVTSYRQWAWGLAAVIG